MEAGVTDRLRGIGGIAMLVEVLEMKPEERAPDKNGTHERIPLASRQFLRQKSRWR